MKSIIFFEVRRDTGSNFNSFTGRYSSLENLLEGFKKNTDLITSLKNDMYYHINWNNDNRKILNKLENLTIDFNIEANSSNNLKIQMKVGNLKLAHGKTIVTPELKQSGLPYIPEKSQFVQESESIESVEYSLPIDKVELILDVVHCDYHVLKDFQGNVIEESSDSSRY